ncbi:MAG: glycosyltransferase [Thermovenabulum sp.]|uniref:glycosyltransferase n=1 Tax=Thermovenabulum sp. TaxID=3100335 RepID=UPI003C7E254A
MLKSVYLADVNFHDPKMIGVVKKILGQKRVFQKNDMQINLIYYRNNCLCLNDDKIKCYQNKIIKRYYRYNDILRVIINGEYDFAYIRYPFSDMKFIEFLKKIKSKHIPVIIEIPTYPYDGEVRGVKGRILHLLDKIYRKKLRSYVDYIVTYSDHREIFGIKCINISNGIDIDSIPIKKSKSIIQNRFNLISVANVSLWHGYDRVIRGLYEYYKMKNGLEVYFHIVGEGDQLQNLKRLTKDLGLEKYVIFHGVKTGSDLDDLFDGSHVAIGSLSMSRVGLSFGKTLKVREYCTRGIPFVIGYEDPDFPDSFKYILKIPDDNTPVDINRIIDFFENAIKNKDYQLEMRKFAEENLSWDVKFKPVIDEIKRLIGDKTG